MHKHRVAMRPPATLRLHARVRCRTVQLCGISQRCAMLKRTRSVLFMAGVCGVLSGCGKASKTVYVLEEPQTVTLTPSASLSSVQQGADVVLHVERRTRGKWKQTPLEAVGPGQCWVYRPPPEVEAEVADKVEWQVIPEGAVSFNREYRLDHTKIATMRVPGTVTLTPRSAVPCEPDRVVEGPAISIEVS